jgi:DNA-binding MarR family transcriptional regulator
VLFYVYHKRKEAVMHDLSRYSDDVRAVLEAQHAVTSCMKGPDFKAWTALDLSIGQLRALMLLSADGDATISDIAARLDVGKPASSILVERLVQLGLARRTEDANDRRRTLVTLTDAGVELITRLRQGNTDRFAAWLEAMAPDDLAALRRGLEALRVVAERPDPHLQIDQTHRHEQPADTTDTGVPSGTVSRS